ncbi:hypothetical protein DFAR_3800016 [Desulfarculales bacterium]
MINCGNNSDNSDNSTKEAFLEAGTESVPRIYLSTAPEVRSKSNNSKSLFRKVVDLRVRAVVVDVDPKSIIPQWVKHVGGTLFNDFG